MILFTKLANCQLIDKIMMFNIITITKQNSFH